eukprot:364253-Chlamydomonas_euryale.AAC.8
MPPFLGHLGSRNVRFGHGKAGRRRGRRFRERCSTEVAADVDRASVLALAQPALRASTAQLGVKPPAIRAQSAPNVRRDGVACRSSSCPASAPRVRPSLRPHLPRTGHPQRRARQPPFPPLSGLPAHARLRAIAVPTQARQVRQERVPKVPLASDRRGRRAAPCCWRGVNIQGCPI